MDGLSPAHLVILNPENVIMSVETIAVVPEDWKIYFVGKTSAAYAEAREKAKR